MSHIADSQGVELARGLADRYAIGAIIAGGGMADVYLATDLRHDREVAIKVMRRETMDALGRQRFLREISIVAKLSHPNIVPLFDSGQIGSLLYYVMPYIEGLSLRDRLTRAGRLELDEALLVVEEVARALTYAHQRGVIHRDIKPGNILIEAGRARVADFGVAKAIEASGTDSVTSGNFAVGTLAYMSPEQASAPSSVDARCDTYALALVLYETLCGIKPFDASTPETMLAAKALGQFRPLRTVLPDVPEHVDAAIARALRPNPSERFGSVAEFVDAVRGASVSSSASRRIRSAQRRSLYLASAAAAIVAIAAGIAAFRRNQTAAPRPSTGLGRIVVAPLHNGTDSKSLDVVGLMAGDWLTEGLQKTSILEVVPPSGMFEIDSLTRKAMAPVRALAEETGAGTVVSGAYYRRGNNLIFRVQVADEGGRRVVGTITDVAGPISDPIRGVEELRNRLMGWLAMHYDERIDQPTAGSAADRPPTFEAYRAFSEGMAQYISSQNERALPLLLEANRVDSAFTQALLYASFAMTNLGDFRRADSLLQVVDRRRKTLTEYDRAWLDFRLGIVRGNGQLALAAMRTATRIAPASKAAYNYAVAAFQNRYIHEALKAIESLQPDRGSMRGFASYWSIYGSIVHALGDYDREEGIGVAARTGYPERLIAFPPLLRALAAKGRIAEIATAMHEARRLPADPYYWDYGLLLTEAAEELRAHGHPKDAASYFTELREWTAARDSVPRMKWRHMQALYALGDWHAAALELRSLRQLDGENVDYIGMTGLLASRLGQREMAALVADTLARRRKPYEFGAANLYRARIAASLGHPEMAVAALEQAFAEGRAYQVWLHRDIDFESLRGYPAFDALVRARD